MTATEKFIREVVEKIIKPNPKLWNDVQREQRWEEIHNMQKSATEEMFNRSSEMTEAEMVTFLNSAEGQELHKRYLSEIRK